MAPRPVMCGRCERPLPEELLLAEGFFDCPACQAELLARAYPARGIPLAPAAPAALPVDGEATCFFHVTRPVSVICQDCGRFICSLCQLELQGAQLCPPCASASLKGRKLKSLEARTVRYDNVALALAITPALMVFPTLVTAPATLFLVFRYWRAPRGLAGSPRLRFLLAGLLALLELGGWAIYFLVVQD